MTPTLLVLRPAPDGERTAAAIRARGFVAIEAPIFAIVPLDWTPPPIERFDALALTSVNAVRHAGRALANYAMLDCYAVGEATAEAARRAGLSVRHIGSGDGAALAEAAAHAGAKRLLHLCGREHRDLGRPGLAVTACPVYAAEPLDRLPAAAGAALQQGAVALLHSPRAASHFAGLVDAAGLARETIAIAAISRATAATAGPDWQAIATAEAPNDDALLAAALAICNHPR